MSGRPEDMRREDGLVAERRERLLRELRPVVLRRGRRRAAIALAGRAVGFACLAGAVVGLVTVLDGASAVRVRDQVASTGADLARLSGPGLGEAAPPSQAPTRSRAEVQIIHTRKGLAGALRTAPRGIVLQATDHDLAEALSAAGQDPGLVRVGGRVVIAGNFGRE